MEKVVVYRVRKIVPRICDGVPIIIFVIIIIIVV